MASDAAVTHFSLQHPPTQVASDAAVTQSIIFLLKLPTQVASDSAAVKDEDALDGRVLLLAAGKKNKLLVRIEG